MNFYIIGGNKNLDNKVSIIVPIYNVEQYLKKCIDSLINQTYKNIEIFLVDDGSTDNSGKICDEFSKKDLRIKVIHKENGGYGSVLEYAINNISSEYFLICDSDDWLELDAVEILINAMTLHNTDLVIARKKLVFLDGSIRNDKNDFRILNSNHIYNDLINFLEIPCSPHSKLYKTSLCKGIKFPYKINNTDFLLYQVYLTKINSAVFIDKELSNYFIDRPGNSYNEDQKLTEKSLKSNSIVTQSTFEQLNKNSKLYKYSTINLFIRACSYIALMKKFNISNEEYYQMNMKVINNSKINKYDLEYFLKSYNKGIKYIVKKLIYIRVLNGKDINKALKILSKFK